MAFEIKDFSYRFHAIEGDNQAVFETANLDQSSATTQYYGFVSLNGRYIIQKKVVASQISTFTYAYGRSAYSTAWTGRASLDYYSYEDLLDNI